MSATNLEIASVQNRVKKSSGDYAGYDSLGAAFLQKAQETGDIAFYDHDVLQHLADVLLNALT